MRPYIKNTPTKVKKLMGEFKGLYTSFGESGCPEGYSPYMKNISAMAYPSIKSREGREVVGEFVERICYLGTLEGKYLFCILCDEDDIYRLYYLDGQEWKYITNFVKGETDRYNSIYFINTNIVMGGVIYTLDGIDKSMTLVIDFEDGQVKFTPEYKMPLSDFIDTIGGRVAAAYSESDKIYLSGIMDRTKWFDVDDGLEVSMITQNCENISAIKTFGDHLVCFKPHAFGELYGNTPDTYTLIMASESIGCIEEKTICDCGKLIWLSDEGICRYGGGALPEIISGAVDTYIQNMDRERISSACAGYDGERYIISLPQKGGGKINLVLNLKTGIFTAEDDTDFVCFTNMGGNLYGATADGRVLKLFTEDESVSWEWKSGVFNMDIEKKNNLRRIYVEGDFSGNITVSIVNNKGKKTEKTITAMEKRGAGKERFYINLHPKDFHGVDSFQVCLKGEGTAKIDSIGLLLRKKDISYGG